MAIINLNQKRLKRDSSSSIWQNVDDGSISCFRRIFFFFFFRSLCINIFANANKSRELNSLRWFPYVQCAAFFFVFIYAIRVERKNDSQQAESKLNTKQNDKRMHSKIRTHIIHRPVCYFTFTQKKNEMIVLAISVNNNQMLFSGKYGELRRKWEQKRYERVINWFS